MKLLGQIGMISLFSGLAEAQLQELAIIVVDQVFRRGQAIFLEGEEGTGFYVVNTGKIKIFKLSPDGKEQILHIFGPGEPFAEVPVFAGQRFPANAEALEESRLFFSPGRVFGTDPAASFPGPEYVGRAVPATAATGGVGGGFVLKGGAGPAGRLPVVSKRPRVRDAGVRAGNRQGKLASLLGTIPETLSRILAKLVKEGLIESAGPRITIVDKAGLQALAAGMRRL